LSLGLISGLLALPLHADTFGSGPHQFVIDFVNVGNAGNGNDLGAGGGIYSSPYGGVAYNYRMATYEISQIMITKAANLGMVNVVAGAWSGNQPAASMSWYEAAAFVNWLNTSQGYSAAYNIAYSGGWSMNLWGPSEQASTGVRSGTNPYRHKDAYYFLPSEDEWYKAAYHQNDGVTANYWDYPTGGNAVPDGINFRGDPNYQAVFWDGYKQRQPNAIANAGSSGSAYGTYGQGGNVWEWNESAWDGANDNASEDRGFRGGSWYLSKNHLACADRSSLGPANEGSTVGFRVASVIPEPTNALPVLVCLQDNFGECGEPASVAIEVSDPDGDALVAVWAVNGMLIQTNAVTPGPSGPETLTLTIEDLSLGTNTVGVAVSDGVNPAVECESLVIVLDTQPPTISALGATPNILWPPNNKLVEVHVSAIVADGCGQATWEVFKVEADEPLCADDFEFAENDQTVRLRAARLGDADSRTYTLWLRATDESGNESEPASVTVTVPHDQRNKAR
jgi:hypothetical protein